MLPDGDLHDAGARGCWGETGRDKLLNREQPPLISAKVHAVRHSILEECDLGDGHGGPVIAGDAELDRADSSADGASIDRSPEKEFAAASTQSGEQGKAKRKRQEASHNTTSVREEEFLQRFYTQRLVIPTGAGAPATAEWRDLLFLVSGLRVSVREIESLKRPWNPPFENL
jgi:hypothetical protein